MEKKHMFSNRDLRKLLIPLVVEQILNSLMGTADSIMVSNVGPAAISAFHWWIQSIFWLSRHSMRCGRGSHHLLTVYWPGRP